MLQVTHRWWWGLLAAVFSLVLAGCEDEKVDQLPPGPYTLVQVYDGDSFNVKTSAGNVIRLRISGIDAPERGQPYGRRSTDALNEMLQSGPIKLTADKKDRFDRWLIRATVNGQDVGLQQIRNGWAWFFRRYKNDLPKELQETYAQAEENARRQRAGLWAWREPPEAPWDYRERTRKEKSADKSSANNALQAPRSDATALAALL